MLRPGRCAASATLAASILALLAGLARGDEPVLPRRVRRIVLHTLGGPTYDRPDRRYVFRTPAETHALWSHRFGAHWIVWTDGTLWPRHPGTGPPSLAPPANAAEENAWKLRVLTDAVPVYSHLHLGNSASVGIEVAHSGRSGDPFPTTQIDTVARLLRTLLHASGGRLTEAAIVGHKDVDRRPAFVRARCQTAGCLVFVDGAGRAYRRRVDPPEGLFRGLAERGMAIPRPPGADEELIQAESIRPEVVPATAAWRP